MNSMSMRRRRHLFHALFDSVPMEERLLQGILSFYTGDVYIKLIGKQYIDVHY